MNETRAKAGAILSGHKLRMLEDAGITVVTKERLEALERLYEATKRRNSIIAEIYDPDFDWDYATIQSARKPTNGHSITPVAFTRQTKTWIRLYPNWRRWKSESDNRCEAT